MDPVVSFRTRPLRVFQDYRSTPDRMGMAYKPNIAFWSPAAPSLVVSPLRMRKIEPGKLTYIPS